MKKIITVFVVVIGLFLGGCRPEQNDISASSPTPTVDIPLSPTAAIPEPNPVISSTNADQLVQTAQYGNGTMRKLLLSPDGKQLIVAGSIGFYILDADTLDEIDFIETPFALNDLAMTQDGKTILLSSYDGLYLLKIASEEITKVFDGDVTDFALSPDENEIVMSVYNPELADRRKLVWVTFGQWEYFQILSEVNRSTEVEFSKTGRYFGFGEFAYYEIWEFVDGFPVLKHDGYCDIGEMIASPSFSPDEMFLAVGATADLCLIHTDSGEKVDALDRGSYAYFDSLVEFSPGGASLAKVSRNFIEIYETQSWEKAVWIEFPYRRLADIVWSLDENYIYMIANDFGVQKWSINRGEVVAESKGGVEFAFLEWSFDGEYLIGITDYDFTNIFLKGWNFESGELSFQYDFEFNMKTVASFPDRNWIAFGSNGNQLTIFDYVSGEEIMVLQGDGGFFSISPEGAYLAIANTVYSEDPVFNAYDLLRIYTTDSWDVVEEIVFEKNLLVEDIEYSPFGYVMLSEEDKIHVWDTFFNEVYTKSKLRLNDLEFSHDGQRMAADGIGDKLLYIFDIEKNIVLSIDFDPGKSKESSYKRGDLFAWSADDSLIAYAGGDGNIYLLDTQALKLISILEGHTLMITDIEFSPDGKTLATTSLDGTVRLWSIP